MARVFRFENNRTPGATGALLCAALGAWLGALGCSDNGTEGPGGSAGKVGASGSAGAVNNQGGASQAGTAGQPVAGKAAGGTTAGGGTGGSGGGTAGSGTPNAGANAAGMPSGGTTSLGGQGGAGNAGAPSSGAGNGGATNGGGNTGGMTGGGGTGGSGAGNGGASAGATSTPDIPCPAGATFCSGFEGTALPAMARFHAVGPSVANPYVFDAEQKFAGNKSLSIPTYSGGFYYRALAVPVPGQNFWVRLHVRVSRTFGDGGHDSLFGASTGALEADVNDEALVEFSEQFDKVLLNTDDQLFNPPGMNTLAANTWHCVEAHYDGQTGNVRVFVGGMEIINASGYAKHSFQSFRIGYMQYHDARDVWYDNVVVAPARVGCN